jgi:hypothetical protein
MTLQKAEITDKLSQLEIKQQEVAKLEVQVKELLVTPPTLRKNPEAHLLSV